jgi:hypothetical protein
MDSQINSIFEWFFAGNLRPFEAVLIFAAIKAVFVFLEYCYGKTGGAR